VQHHRTTTTSSPTSRAPSTHGIAILALAGQLRCLHDVGKHLAVDLVALRIRLDLSCIGFKPGPLARLRPIINARETRHDSHNAPTR
jgi:hypothetical protein